MVVGTRPEIIRMSRILAALDSCCNLVLIHTGQNFDRNLRDFFLDELVEQRVDYSLNCAATSFSAAETIGKIIIEVDKILDAERPNAFLVLGDTNSCLSAIAAKKRKIPVFHFEAGNRCFDERVPEETNRKIVDHLADINLTYSQHAKNHLLSEGKSSDTVICIGSPLFEVIEHYSCKIDQSDVLLRFGLKSQEFYLASCHREENVDSEYGIQKLIEILNYIPTHYSIPVVVSVHPRTMKKLEGSLQLLHEMVLISPPLGFFDYVCLQKNALVVLSDSGSITEEAAILGINALNLREVHERPEGMDQCVVPMVGMNLEAVKRGIRLLENRSSPAQFNVADYQRPDVSRTVTEIVHSYVDFVNTRVWRKGHISE